MEWLLVGFVLGALVMFAFTRHHATQAELFRRLYEEATKGGAAHLHDALTVEAARRIVERAEHEALDADGEEVPRSAPPPRQKGKPAPAPAPAPARADFPCFDCDEIVKWGSSECRACEARYSYAGGVARRA